MRILYPEITPYSSGKLTVSDVHELYWEESGNPDGKPVVFLHGGPGGGTESKHRRYFDPRRYRIILFDQRGCGRSTPHASLVDNTTWDLVDDMERLRSHLSIDQWQLFGGSWGSTLALAYAQTHPDRVTEMILRGIFTFTRAEMEWFYGRGTRHVFPDAWSEFVAPLSGEEKTDVIGTYYQRLTSSDPSIREAAARTWSMWECRVATLLPDTELVRHCNDASFTVAFARIESHYFVHGGFLRKDTQLLDDVPRIRDIPCTMIHGRYDVICPLKNAWELHRRWPGSRLVVVEKAGHSANEPGIVSALVQAADDYA